MVRRVATPPDRCADIRLSLAEPVFATAPAGSRNWILVEHPGPWPVTGLPDDLPARTREVLQAGNAAGIRVQLIRRLRDRQSQEPMIAVAGRSQRRGWLESRRVSDLDELVDLDLDLLRRGRPPGWGTALADASSFVLVCTHGRRDVCCARLGRPVAVALDRQLPGQVWETSHVGGDRFAASVITLPGGEYHGALNVGHVDQFCAAIRADRLLLPFWRGRAGDPSAAQAAEYFLRHELGLTAADAVRCGRTEPGADQETIVELSTAAGDRYRLRVAAHRRSPRRTTCSGADATVTPIGFQLVQLTPAR